MNARNHQVEAKEYYRGSEFSPNAGEPVPNIARPISNEARTAFEANGALKDPAGEEREKWLDNWMQDIKAFIRNIDVSSL